MHLFDQRILGLLILFLLGILVVVKRMATGSILDKPKGSLMVQLVNGFNLFFLLIVNPLAGLLLITRRPEMIDSVRVIIHRPMAVNVIGDCRIGVLRAGVSPHGLGLNPIGRQLSARGKHSSIQR